MTGASRNGRLTAHPESLFDRFPWLYAFCRDHLFRDDTGRIAASLWAAGVPPAGNRLLELGCGPGFYARRLGETFGHLEVTGVDRSELQLGRARMLAAAGSLGSRANRDAIRDPVQPRSDGGADAKPCRFGRQHQERCLKRLFRIVFIAKRPSALFDRS